MLIDHKPSNYDGKYKGPTPQIGCWSDGGCQYDVDVGKKHWEKGLFIG
jgi:hypothetical protein